LIHRHVEYYQQNILSPQYANKDALHLEGIILFIYFKKTHISFTLGNLSFIIIGVTSFDVPKIFNGYE